MGSNTDLLGKLDAAGLDDSFQSDFLLGRTVVFGCDGYHQICPGIGRQKGSDPGIFEGYRAAVAQEDFIGNSRV